MPGELEIICIGNAAADAQVKKKKNGGDYVSFSLGVNLKRGDERVTKWVQVVCFTQYTMSQAQNIIKGQTVFVRGDPEASVYEQQGKPARANLSIFATTVYIIDYFKKPQEETPAQGGQDGNGPTFP